MNKKFNRIAVTLCGLISLVALVAGMANVAHAVAGAQSSASIMVDPFTDPRATLTRLTTEGFTTSQSPKSYQVDPANPVVREAWEDVQFNTSIYDSAYNNASSGASSTGSTIDQFASVAADGSGEYSANAYLAHDVNFTYLATTGNMVVSGAFDVLMQAYADTPRESASVYLLVGIYLRNLTQNTESSLEKLFEFTNVTIPLPVDSSVYALSDLFSQTLSFNNGDEGSFRIIVDGNATASSVPEPSTLALLGLGLVGAALLKKRTRN